MKTRYEWPRNPRKNTKKLRSKNLIATEVHGIKKMPDVILGEPTRSFLQDRQEPACRDDTGLADVDHLTVARYRGITSPQSGVLAAAGLQRSAP